MLCQRGRRQMLFLRLSGSALLLVSAVFGARYLNKKAEGVILELDGFFRLIRQIRLEVESFSLPISKILVRIDRALLADCGYIEDTPPSSLEDLSSKIKFKGEKGRELFLGFCSDFGNSYRDEEIRKLTYYETLLRDERERLAKELPAKKKINATLAVSAALGIVILMI